jgi:hypothetical protein
MAKYAIFTLSMPNNNSWNGRWTGQDKKYIEARELPKGKTLLDHHSYNFGDGWRAVIDIQIVDDVKRKNKLMKYSDGFCGYDWMIDSIMKHGAIKTDD